MVTFRRTNSCFFYRIKLVCVIYLQNLVCCPEKASSLHSPPDNCKFKPAQNTLQRGKNQVFCYRLWQENSRFIIHTVVKGLFIKNNFENTTSCSKAEMKNCWKKHAYALGKFNLQVLWTDAYDTAFGFCNEVSFDPPGSSPSAPHFTWSTISMIMSLVKKNIHNLIRLGKVIRWMLLKSWPVIPYDVGVSKDVTASCLLLRNLFRPNWRSRSFLNNVTTVESPSPKNSKNPSPSIDW